MVPLIEKPVKSGNHERMRDQALLYDLWDFINGFKNNFDVLLFILLLFPAVENSCGEKCIAEVILDGRVGVDKSQ